MNARDRYMRQRESLNTLKSLTGSNHVNCFRTNTNNTDDHELRKYEIYRELRKRGRDVIVEAEFKTGGRADVLDLDGRIIYEVLCTETKERFQEKQSKYPDVFETRAVNAAEPWDPKQLD